MSEKKTSTIEIVSYTVSAKTKGLPIEILRLFPAILTCIAAFYSYKDLFSPILSNSLIYLSVAFAIAFTAIFSIKRFSYKAIAVGLSFLGIFLFYLRYKDILAIAVSRLIRDLIIRINFYYHTNLDLPKSPSGIGGVNSSVYPSILFIAALIILSLLVCYFLSHNGGVVIILAVAGIHLFISANITANATGQVYTLPLILLVIAAVQAISLSGYNARGYSPSAFMTRFDLPALPKSINTSSLIILTLAISIFLIIVPQKIDKNNYSPNTKIVDKAVELSQKVTAIATDPSAAFPINISLGGGIGKGKLSSNFGANSSDATRLRIKAEHPVPMLVKGYVGSVYDGKRWTPSTNERLADITNRMIVENIPPERIQMMYLANISRIEGIYPSSTVEIQNVSSDNSFFYTPYFFWSDQIKPESIKSETLKNDGWLGKTSLTGTSYVYSQPQSNRYFRLDFPYPNPFYHPEDVPEHTKSFLNQDRQMLHDEYDSYIRELYTELPENMEFIEDIASHISDTAIQNNYNPFDAVAAYLSENAEYDLNPGSPPDGMDYTEYFLTENHRGYCVHFATAGALILRSMGIPARYVEGYVVRNEDFKSLDSEGFANIPSKNAHAWVEYWTPYLGWRPFDPTPSYGDIQSEELGSSMVEGSILDQPTDEGEFKDDTSSTTVSSEPTSSEAISSEPVSDSSQTSSDISSEASNTVGDISSSDNSTGENDAVSKSKPLSNVAKSMIALFLVIFCIFIAIFLRKYLICWLLTRKLLQDKDSGTIAAYHHAMKILAMAGLKPQPLQGEGELQFINKLDTILIERERMQLLYELAQKAGFAEKGVSIEERNLSLETALKLCKSYYTVASPYKKILYKLFSPEFKRE